MKTLINTDPWWSDKGEEAFVLFLDLVFSIEFFLEIQQFFLTKLKGHIAKSRGRAKSHQSWFSQPGLLYPANHRTEQHVLRKGEKLRLE